jgi:hypothetical protein
MLYSKSEHAAGPKANDEPKSGAEWSFDRNNPVRFH